MTQTLFTFESWIMQLNSLRYNISPVILVFWGKTFELLQPEHWILEHWTIQNLFWRLVKELTHLQMFKSQIQKNIFSKMLKAWIVQNQHLLYVTEAMGSRSENLSVRILDLGWLNFQRMSARLLFSKFFISSVPPPPPPIILHPSPITKSRRGPWFYV